MGSTVWREKVSSYVDRHLMLLYGIAITGLIPDKSKALSKNIRVVKPGGMIGGLECFSRDEAKPDVEASINLTMGKVVSSGTRVMKLDDWISLIDETGLCDGVVDASFEDVFDNPGFELGTILTYFKLVYYLIYAGRKP